MVWIPRRFIYKKLKNSYFIGKISLADITAWRVIRWFTSGNLEQVNTKFIEKFPNLKLFTIIFFIG